MKAMKAFVGGALLGVFAVIASIPNRHLLRYATSRLSLLCYALLPITGIVLTTSELTKK